jgi:hypothetical protein
MSGLTNQGIGVLLCPFRRAKCPRHSALTCPGACRVPLDPNVLGSVGQEGHETRPLDRSGEHALVPGASAGLAARANTAAITHELAEQPKIFVVDLFGPVSTELADPDAATIIAAPIATSSSAIALLAIIAARPTVIAAGVSARSTFLLLFRLCVASFVVSQDSLPSYGTYGLTALSDPGAHSSSWLASSSMVRNPWEVCPNAFQWIISGFCGGLFFDL